MNSEKFWEDNKLKDKVLELVKIFPKEVFSYDDFLEWAKYWGLNYRTGERMLRKLVEEGKLLRIKKGRTVLFCKRKDTIKTIEILSRRFIRAVNERNEETRQKILRVMKKHYGLDETEAIQTLLNIKTKQEVVQ